MTHAADLEAEIVGECRVVLTIPAKPEFVALSRLAVAALGGWAELPVDVVADLKVAVTEACAVLLGRPPADDAPQPPTLEVTFDLGEDRWVMRVVTRGTLTEEPDVGLGRAPTEGGPELEGLGPAIIRALVDAVDVEGEEHCPSALRFTKTVR